MRGPIAVVVGLSLCVALARPAHATCEADAAALRTHLETEKDRADGWNFAWRLTFTIAAVGTLVGGLVDPKPSWNLRDGLLVSAGKATIGASARWFMPLALHVPVAAADPCTDLAALRKEALRVGKKERTLFLMGHVGGLAVNVAGAAIIYYRASLGQALLSVAVGYPVGLFSNYTMPRNTWHLTREQRSVWETSTVGVSKGENGRWMLSLTGAF